MANPIFILHLTDFHLTTDISAAFYSPEAKLKLISQNLINFLKVKARDSFNILCLTGDMVNQNGNDLTNHSLTVNFINELKEEGIIHPENTRIYSAPGNHDVDFSIAEKVDSKVNKKRKEYFTKIKDNIIPDQTMFQIVDEHENELVNLFGRYQDFVLQIGANKVTLVNNHLYGHDFIEPEGIFVSWFNTSWLCLKDSTWNDICDINSNASLKVNDHEKISPGYTIYSDIFNNSLIRNSNFSLALFHHDVRLLNWHDKYDYKNITISPEYKHDSFYSKIHKFDYILNGHTHGDLFDGNSNTGQCIAEKNLENFIIIHEVDLLRKFVIQHKIKITDNPLVEKDIIHRIIAFRPNQFLENMRNNYSKSDLENDLKCNLSDTEYQNILKADRELEILSLNEIEN